MKKTLYCIVAFLGLLACGSPSAEIDTGTPDNIDPEMQGFIQLMNEHRQSVGCQALAWNPTLATMAQSHSQDMSDQGYMDHVSPQGVTFQQRIIGAHVPFSSAGENVAFGSSTGDGVLQQWLNSSGHRQNIENCTYNQQAVGKVGTYWTDVFIKN